MLRICGSPTETVHNPEDLQLMRVLNLMPVFLPTEDLLPLVPSTMEIPMYLLFLLKGEYPKDSPGIPELILSGNLHLMVKKFCLLHNGQYSPRDITNSILLVQAEVFLKSWRFPMHGMHRYRQMAIILPTRLLHRSTCNGKITGEEPFPIYGYSHLQTNRLSKYLNQRVAAMMHIL